MIPPGSYFQPLYRRLSTRLHPPGEPGASLNHSQHNVPRVSCDYRKLWSPVSSPGQDSTYDRQRGTPGVGHIFYRPASGRSCLRSHGHVMGVSAYIGYQDHLVTGLGFVRYCSRLMSGSPQKNGHLHNVDSLKNTRVTNPDHDWSTLEERIAKHTAAAIADYLQTNNMFTKQSSKWSSAGWVLLVFVACGLTVLYVESVRQSLSEATGNAAGGLLHSKAFVDQSMRFLHRLSEDYLNSPETEQLFRKKFEELLINSQDALHEAVKRVLRDEDVINVAYDLSQEVSAQLCRDPEVIELVGQLLLDAIYTETAVNGAANWFVDLTQRDDVCNSLEALLCDRVFADAKIQLEALNFCKDVTSRFLRDQETRRESLLFIKSLLERPSLQAQLSQALLGVVKHSIYPRWLISQEGPSLTGFPKHIDKQERPSESPSSVSLRFF
ncbi:hypothetical protein BaOVIS_017060 [Babesia ovis]|uniref:Uncharacterized protein n=1 Tax=Babesia ovis TaxID=5869 RepID=A0A9W5TD81_BABOV|nr:hypothetical protein BaOVIS_017060 [Babesia ovis]